MNRMEEINDAILKINAISEKIHHKLIDPKARLAAVATFLGAQSSNVQRSRGESVCHNDVTCVRGLHNSNVPVRPPACVPPAPFLRSNPGADAASVLPELK